MDRVGFSLVAMSFTGAEALQFKVAYANAFEAGEEQLKAGQLDWTNPADLRRALLGYVDRTEIAEAKVEAMAPKVEAFENLADPELGASKPSDTAKALGIPERQFFRDLAAMGWVYKDGENYVGYAAIEAAGLIEHRPSTWTDRFRRSHFRLQVWITPKGRQQLSLHYVSRRGTLLERRSPAALPAPAADLLQ